MLLRGKKKTSREVSLFESIGQDKEGNEICLVDVIEQQQPDILESMELAGEIKKLFRLMREKLTDREQEILVMRYGLLGKREQTQNEIGDRLGISRSYVSRIEKKPSENSGQPLNWRRKLTVVFYRKIHYNNAMDLL